jgi:D-xylonolactonase
VTAPVVEAVANYHCVVGENPLWNADDQSLYWADIETGRLFRAEHATGRHECFYEGPITGGFTRQADGSLLLFEENRIATLDARGARRVLLDGIDSDMRRFNDVIADPEGRVFAGTIGSTDTNGGLYRVDTDGRVTCILKETGIANGMAFTADGQGFYWTCSTTKRIFRFDYRREDGALTNRRLFHTASGPYAEYDPDGLTLDVDDRVYSARWGASCVLRLDDRGEVAERIELPVPRVSSVAFGGPKLDVMYVTTAAAGAPNLTGADGTLYRVTGLGTRGRAEFRSRILL